MANFDQATRRALELDDLLVEISEALRYVRAMARINAKNPTLEHTLSRAMAIGCIRRLHSEMHNPQHPNFYAHRYGYECRNEVIRRGQSLRYTEVRELMKFARESHRAYIPTPHWLELEDGDHLGGRCATWRREPEGETVA